MRFYERTIGGRLEVLRNGSSWELLPEIKRNFACDKRLKLNVLVESAD